jgi:CheY-like chemotaxis protein
LSAEISPAPVHRLRVVSVEDEPQFSERVRRFIEADGFAVAMERAHSVAELEQTLHRQTWNVVLSDHSIPAISSEEALKLIKAPRLDQATRDSVAALGCPVAQGYHFSAPVPADSFKDWTRAWASS